MYKIIAALLLLTGSALGQSCAFTNANMKVNSGATFQTTVANCPSATYSVACTGTGCQSGAINSSGLYTAPVIWARNVVRGCQLLPDDSIYKAPITGLPVHSHSARWIQAQADLFPADLNTYHNLKFANGQPVSYYTNVVDGSTPTQLLHGLNGNGIWQDTSFSIAVPPNVTTEGGWSQDAAVNPDDHHDAVSPSAGCDYTEIYDYYPDYQTATWSTGTVTTVNFTSHTVRALPNPLRVYVYGATGTCSSIGAGNGGGGTGQQVAYLATVVSYSGGSGVLTIPYNSTSCTGTPPFGAGIKIESHQNSCPLCNTGGAAHWNPASNGAYGQATDASGFFIASLVPGNSELFNVTQQGILDPACNCVTLGHALQTLFANYAISPRDVWPSLTGFEVTGGHPNMQLLSATNANPAVFTISSTGCGGTSCLTNQIPCYHSGTRSACIAGDTTPITIATTSGWAGAAGDQTLTVIDGTHFSIPVNSTAFGALPANSTFIFDWMPYGTRFRLKSSFNVAAYCTGGLTTTCPYKKTLLNNAQVYGYFVDDGTGGSSSWDSGRGSDELHPDVIVNAYREIAADTSLQPIEGLMEIVDESSLQANLTPAYTDPTNQILQSTYRKVTVTVNSSNGSASQTVFLQGTAVGVTPGAISIVAGTTYQINSWVTGNNTTTVTYACALCASVGASVSGSGLITSPPTTLTQQQFAQVIITSTADTTAQAALDVYFIPQSPDGHYRLAFGNRNTFPQYVDSFSNQWFGALPTRPWNSPSGYEIAEGIGFGTYDGTWQQHAGSWTGADPQLYAQSLSTNNDLVMYLAVPNGSYTLKLYGEPGLGVTTSGQNVFDVEVNGAVVDSYKDGFLSAGGVYMGYTNTYNATVSNGVLEFAGRIRELPANNFYGMSMSSLEVIPGGLPLAICTASLPNATMGTPYSQPICINGGTPSYTCSITVGSLPAGLGIAACVIAGTPTTVSTNSFTLQVCDAVPNCQTQPLSIQVFPTAPSITTTSPLPAGTVTVPYSVTITGNGGTPPYTWSVNGFAIPGLGIASSGSTTALYSGNPSAVGVYAPSIHICDANSVCAVKLFSGTIVSGSSSSTRSSASGGNSGSGSQSIQ